MCAQVEEEEAAAGGGGGRQKKMLLLNFRSLTIIRIISDIF